MARLVRFITNEEVDIFIKQIRLKTNAELKMHLMELRLSNYFMNAAMRNVDLSGMDLSELNLSGVNLTESNLSRANLRKSTLNGANLNGVDLTGADLTEAELYGLDDDSIDYNDQETWEVLEKLDLEDYDFVAYLRETKLVGAKLVKVDLRGVNLSKADLREADLSGANLSGANLKGCNLTGVDLSGAKLIRANLSEANLTNANLAGADLTKAIFVQTNLANANLSNARIFGISAWDLTLDTTKQSDLIITKEPEPVITVDNLQVAQFIYLLLNNKNIRSVFDTIGSKAVLILGRFTDERKAILDAIREELRKHNYTPILFDFDKPTNRNFTETVATLVGMARFVIADLSDPNSIPHELMSFVEKFRAVPIQPIFCPVPEHKREFSMFQDYVDLNHVLPIVKYESQEQLIAFLLEKIIRSAEDKANEIQDKRNKWGAS